MRARRNPGASSCPKTKGFKDSIANVLVPDSTFYYCWGSGGDDGNDAHKFELTLRQSEGQPLVYRLVHNLTLVRL